ncbi:MAG: gluconate 2-dehydrogenase subunit 3 family protein [Polyangiaceae bacterium]|jgi:gluconate 2-dehydrogenase gamma chain
MMGLGAVEYTTDQVGCQRVGSKTKPSAAEAGSFPRRTFTPAAFAILSAICERLLPRDEDPGAIDLGVPGYIDRAVAEPELAPVRDLLLRVLPIVDRQSRTRFEGRPFQDATPTEQDEILGRWQRGHDGGQSFFSLILSLTLEGAFSDPKYGGNSEGRGFAMTGFRPGPPLTMASHPHPAYPK